MALGKIEASGISSLILVRAETWTESERVAYPRFAACERDFVLHVENIRNDPDGDQRCWWLNHAAGDWANQPLVAAAANSARSRGLGLADTMINLGFRRADAQREVTMLIYVDPTSDGITTMQSSWSASPWHPQNIASDPAREDYVDDQIAQTTYWLKSSSHIRERVQHPQWGLPTTLAAIGRLAMADRARRDRERNCVFGETMACPECDRTGRRDGALHRSIQFELEPVSERRVNASGHCALTVRKRSAREHRWIGQSSLDPSHSTLARDRSRFNSACNRRLSRGACDRRASTFRATGGRRGRRVRQRLRVDHSRFDCL